MKKTVINLLHRAVEKYGDSPYLAEKVDKIWLKDSFKDIDQKSDVFASKLLALQFSRESKISILAEGRTAWVVAEYGIVKSSCIAVPLSVKLTQEEILFRILHSDSLAIVTSHNHIQKIIPLLSEITSPDFKIIYLDDDKEFIQKISKQNSIDLSEYIIYYQDIIKGGKLQMEELSQSIDSIEEDDVVTISYTSGTTGNPKGIMLTHKNYYANSMASYESFDIRSGSKLFNVLPLDHSFAHTVGIYVSTLIPYTIYFLDTKGGPMAALKNIPLNISEVKPNLMLSVPALSAKFMKNIINGIEKKGDFIKGLFQKGLKASMQFKTQKGVAKWLNYPLYIIAKKLIFKKIIDGFGGEMEFMVGGGALLDIKQQEFFYAIGMPVYQGYGLTEASPVISSNTPVVHKLGTSGKVIPNLKCMIMDDGKIMPQGKRGEIVVDGDSVMKGYYKNPTATTEAIQDGLLFTGDLGYYDEDGFLMVSGRAKALLISEDGEKYSPEEIEETILSSSPFVEHALLYNDHSKFTSALFTLQEEVIRTYIKKNSISSPEELLKVMEETMFSFKNDPQFKGKFQEKWMPNTYRFVDERFTEENKMVNSTMKMVRFKITEHYKELIDEMYQKDKKASQVHNLMILKKYFDS